MARQPQVRQSLKSMASAVTEKVTSRFRDEMIARSGEEFDIETLRMKYIAWIEKVSNFTADDLNVARVDGRLIDIDGVAYIPDDLLIVKEYRNKGVANHLIDILDKRKSHGIPLGKLFTPSLFPQLEYKTARKQWLILGETNRVEVGYAGPDHWRLYEGIKKKNFEAQEAAWKEDKANFKRGHDLFRKTREPSTDALMRRLGVWDGKDD